MPLNYSNVVSPAQSALQNKMNPLSSLSAGVKSNLGANIGIGAAGNIMGSSIAPYKPPVAAPAAKPAVSPIKPAPAAPLAVTPVTPPTSTPAPSTGLVGGLIGTQHPGDAGFAPTASKPQAPSATAEYDANGQYAGTIGGSTGNNQTPGATTFPGILGALSTASQNGSGTATVAGNGLLQAPQQNQVLGDKAAQIGDQYGKQIANVGERGAQFEGGQLTTGTSPVASGNAAITAQTTAASQQALASGEAAALQGNAQQLTAQNQAQSGLSNAGSIGNTAQANEQSGLNAAGQLAQPSPAAYGQTSYDPVTGQYTGGGGLPPDVMAQYAQMAANGQYSAIPSSITGNAVLSAQLNQAATALNPNYNPINSAAQGAAGAANIQTAGTAGTSTAAQGYSGAAQNYTSYTGANTAAEAQAKQVQGVLASTGLNQGVPDYNKAINSLSGRLGATNVAQLSTALTELQNMYSQILSVGGTTPTGSEAQALSVLNPNSSAAQINASIQQLQQASYNRGTGLYSQLQTYSKNLGQGGSAGNTGGSGGSIQTSYGTINPNL